MNPYLPPGVTQHDLDDPPTRSAQAIRDERAYRRSLREAPHEPPQEDHRPDRPHHD